MFTPYVIQNKSWWKIAGLKKYNWISYKLKQWYLVKSGYRHAQDINIKAQILISWIIVLFEKFIGSFKFYPIVLIPIHYNMQTRILSCFTLLIYVEDYDLRIIISLDYKLSFRRMQTQPETSVNPNFRTLCTLLLELKHNKLLPFQSQEIRLSPYPFCKTTDSHCILLEILKH